MSTDKYTVWVGNLNYDTRTRDLEYLFEEAGRIRRVFHPFGKGYAFIEFERYGKTTPRRRRRKQMGKRTLPSPRCGVGSYIKSHSTLSN